MFDVTHGDFRMKFKIETPTLIFSANKELVVVKYMALEFSEGSLVIVALLCPFKVLGSKC